MERRALAAVLDEAIQRHADRACITSEERTLTYREFGQEIARAAETFRAAGVGQDDRIVVSIANGPEYLAAAAAAWECGAVHVGADAEATSAELSYLADITRARLLLRGPHGGIETLRLSTSPDGGDRPAVEDAAIVFVSSGTTGKPKATIGFHRNLSQRWSRLGGWLSFRPGDVHLAHLPLSHGFGFMMAMAALLSGGRLVTQRRFTGDGAIDAIASERVTVFNGSPTHFKLLLNRLRASPRDVACLRLAVGTAAIFAPSLIESIWSELSVDFVHMYGSSEGVGVATTDREDIRLGSVGRPPAGSTRIVGVDRRDLPVGETGEIAFSRKVYPVTYWPAQSDAGDRGEWFYSGDLGRLDEQGRLYVFGRLKHQIDRGGLKIDPVEVERALLECAGVADAAVLGIPDSILGETVCACVVPKEGWVVTLDRLRGELGRELAAYKLPSTLQILDAIPRTTLGKIDLATLRARCVPQPAH